ncbi:hypothetical protein G9A89_015421 [Geosiphon pyriformis]|nr:hypothetical protein G9A89_015421 [Geosiphon pyriformis]
MNLEELFSKISATHHIKTGETTKRKLEKILNDGFQNLHFLCDFDRTMTHLHTQNNEINPSSHGILSSGSSLKEDFKTKVNQLYQKYFPIEMDPNLTDDEKTPLMVEWWEKAHRLLIDQHISRNDIAQIVSETPVEVRSGLDKVITKCEEHNIPFLVFSAGITNVIEEVLRSKNLLRSNMHIVSNQMGFNPLTGICDHFKPPLIHIFNKSEFMLEKTPYYFTISERKNVILLGDSIGDLEMSSGVKHDICLNIGFLNDHVEELLDKYLNAFDIVVVHDGPIDVVSWILETIS